MISESSFSSFSAPTSAKNGDFWFNTTTRRLNIYSEGIWVDLTQEILDFYKVGEKDERNVNFSHYAPMNPKRGDIWYDRNNNKVYIFSDEVGFDGWKSLHDISTILQFSSKSLTNHKTF